MKPKVYIETTIPSYLVARPTRDLVVDEAGGGDRRAAKERLRLLRGIAELDVSEEATSLAELLVARSAVPSKAATDAGHIAVASVHAMDFLVTWNCAHLANAMMASRISTVCDVAGYKCPVICTPEGLFEE